MVCFLDFLHPQGVMIPDFVHHYGDVILDFVYHHCKVMFILNKTLCILKNLLLFINES